jgi:hypothetical protein
MRLSARVMRKVRIRNSAVKVSANRAKILSISVATRIMVSFLFVYVFIIGVASDIL